MIFADDMLVSLQRCLGVKSPSYDLKHKPQGLMSSSTVSTQRPVALNKSCGAVKTPLKVARFSC